MIQTGQMPGILLCRHAVTSKKQLLESLCRRVARHAGLCERTVLDSVIDREKLGSTAIGNGIALPHATIAGAATTCSLLATLGLASRQLRASSHFLRAADSEAALRNAVIGLLAAA